MLQRLPGFIGASEADQMMVPPFRAGRSLLGDDPEDVRKIIERIDQLPYERILNARECIGRGHRNRLDPASIVNAVQVVGPGKGISVAREAKPEQPFAAEEINAGVDAGGVKLLDSGAKAIEVGLIEFREIELWFFIRRVAWTGALPRLGSDGEIG